VKSQVKWTDDEVSLLKEHGTKLLHELIELLPKHTAMGISVKRKRLGVELPDNYASEMGKRNRSLLDNDKLCKTDQSIKLDDLDNTTKQVILGSILGDGSIKKNGSGGKMRDKWSQRNFIFYDMHRSPQEDYTDWKASKLQTFLAKSSRKPEDNRSEMWTVSHPIFTTLRDKFYPARTKCNKCMIPADMVEQMDELALLVWYFDDGYIGVRPDGLNTKGHHRRPAPSISAKGWNHEDLCNAAEILNKNLGLHLYIGTHKHRDGINKLVKIPAEDRDVLFPKWQELAKEHGVPECMMYKLNLHEWRDMLVA